MNDQEMNNTLDEVEKSNRQLIVWLLLGIVAIGCGILFAAAFVLFQPNMKSLTDQYFPSPTATITRTPTPTSTATLTPTKASTPTLRPSSTSTSTPRALISPPEDVPVLEEKFDLNSKQWESYYNNNTTLIQNEHLIVRSDESGYVGAATCADCPIYDKSFYFQADVKITSKTTDAFGLIFCSREDVKDYYVFQIDTQYRNWQLLKSTSSGWERLVEDTSPSIKNYPGLNTLGIIHRQGNIRMYINGIHVETYQDTSPLVCEEIGFLINDSEASLIVDNVFAFPLLEEIPTETPTPNP